MKIRNGFVSNSSSSSFVVYGAKMKDYNDDMPWKKLYEKQLSINEDVLGVTLMSEVEEQNFEKVDFNPVKIKTTVEDFANENGIELVEDSFGLYAGNTEN